MLECSNCGSKQAEGKFCGSCGGTLIEASAAETAVEEHVEESKEQPVQVKEEVAATEVPGETAVSPSSNEMVDQAVGISKEFGSYFKEYIKAPSLIFAKGESEFKNSLISLAIMSLLFALTLSSLYRNFDVHDVFMMPSAFSIFGTSLLFIVIVTAVILALLFLINKLFGTESSIKKVTSIFGTHMIPVNILALLTLVLALLKSNTAGWSLLFIVFGLVVTAIPVYIISSLLTKRSKAIDPLYGYLLYLVAVSITFIILLIIFVDSAIGNLLEDISYYL